MSSSKEMSKKPAKTPVHKEKRGLGKRLKEVFSELKKVTWPSFSKTMKQTGVVVVVVAFFLVLITGADYGLSALLNLLAPLA